MEDIMNAKVLRVLEYDKVIRILEAKATSTRAASCAAALNR